MTEPNQLPYKQQEILDFIQDFLQEHGYAPSVREIGSAVSISSTSVVHGFLRHLEEAGYLRRDPSKPRAMVVLSGMSDKASRDILLDGRGKAITEQSEKPFSQGGHNTLPFLPFDNITSIDQAKGLGEHMFHSIDGGQWFFPRGTLPEGDCFVTVMPDDCMVNRQIAAGDYLLVRKQDTASSGDVIIAAVKDEIMIRTYFQGLRQVRLQAENDQLGVTQTDHQELTIIGVVIGFQRLFSSASQVLISS